EPPQAANSDLQIFNVRPGGGWARGPAIRGEVIPPSGDWLRVMPGGTRKLDVRISIRADDGAIIFMTYVGRSRATADVVQRLEPGETLGPAQLNFLIPPPFKTAAPAYAWLNDVVAIGKIVSLNRSANRHVTYDIFAAR